MGAKRTEAEKTRAALAKALGAAGYDVKPQYIRQRRDGDVARRHLWRWEAAARRRLDGHMVTIRSWDTMGACARRGVDEPTVEGVVRARSM